MLSVSTFRTCVGRYGTDEEQGTRQATEVGQWEKASSDTYVSLVPQGDTVLRLSRLSSSAPDTGPETNGER